MKIWIKTGLVVIAMGFLINLLMGGATATKADIAALAQNGAVLIDVRSAGEFSGGHIKGSINIQHDQIDRLIGSAVKDKNQSIIVYCHSGMRAAAAKKTLEKMGYAQVANGGGLHHMHKALGQ